MGSGGGDEMGSGGGDDDGGAAAASSGSGDDVSHSSGHCQCASLTHRPSGSSLHIANCLPTDRKQSWRSEAQQRVCQQGLKAAEHGAVLGASVGRGLAEGDSGRLWKAMEGGGSAEVNGSDGSGGGTAVGGAASGTAGGGMAIGVDMTVGDGMAEERADDSVGGVGGCARASGAAGCVGNGVDSAGCGAAAGGTPLGGGGVGGVGSGVGGARGYAIPHLTAGITPSDGPTHDFRMPPRGFMQLVP